MKANWLIPAIAFPMAMFLLLVIGCEGEQGPQGPAGTSPIYIVGAVGTPGLPWSVDAVYVMVSISDQIPSVQINNIQIPYKPYQLPPVFSLPQFPINVGEEARLVVTYTKLDGSQGIAQATTVMPGSFAITSPAPDSFLIAIGDSLTVQWNASSGADAYFVSFSFNYHYHDFSGDNHSFWYYNDTLVASTEITYPSINLFPDLPNIDTVEFSEGSVSIWAVSGPAFPVDWDNVTGDGIGVFNGWSFGADCMFWVSGPIPMLRQNESPKDRIKEFFSKRFGSLSDE